jgi:SAM-dependent methyltransferase
LLRIAHAFFALFGRRAAAALADEFARALAPHAATVIGLDATDGTPAMVRKANERFDVGARLLRFDELDSVSEYDAVWAHACLLHVARADLSSVLASIHRALRPGGWHFANYKLGDSEGRDLLGRLHNFPDAGWLEEVYRAAGFAIVVSEIYPGKAADGTQRDWMAMMLQRTCP